MFSFPSVLSAVVHRILKTAIHPLTKFIFKYLLELPLPAAKNAKGLFKYRNSSGNNTYYCADDGQFCHWVKCPCFLCSHSWTNRQIKEIKEINHIIIDSYNSAYCFAIFSMSKQTMAFFLAFKHRYLCHLSSDNNQQFADRSLEYSKNFID